MHHCFPYTVKSAVCGFTLHVFFQECIPCAKQGKGMHSGEIIRIIFCTTSQLHI